MPHHHVVGGPCGHSGSGSGGGEVCGVCVVVVVRVVQ
jgi:hypothetical protein